MAKPASAAKNHEGVRQLQMLLVHCEEGNIEGVNEILENGLLDVNSQLASDQSPLAVAIKHHHLAIAEYLISRGANVNSLNKVSHCWSRL